MRLKIDLPDRVPVDPVPEDRTELHGLMGRRVEGILKDHFGEKDKVPNRLGGEKTHFWDQVAKSTLAQTPDGDGVDVVIADERFAIHLFGGTVEPKQAKALTIPIDRRAHGKQASVLENELGVSFFVVQSKAGKAFLASSDGEGNLSFWYLLAKSAEIPVDPDALPEEGKIEDALQDMANRYFERRLA